MNPTTRVPWCTFWWLLGCSSILPAADPFTLSGPGVDPTWYRITTFASDLNYPVGMAELADGSMLVAVSNGGNFFGSARGSLIRLADDNRDGVADSRTVLTDSVPGGALTSLRVAGDLVFVTGQGGRRPISIYRLGQQPTDPVSLIGTINLNYPAGSWLHPHSALAVQRFGDLYQLFFQMGSEANFAPSERTVSLTSDIGATATLLGDSLYVVDIRYRGRTLTAERVTQIATGLRNPAGMAFHPLTGDLYFEDNGIDGVVNANEPTSADELNRISGNSIGQDVIDFGFPSTYVEYRTGNQIGSQGVPPLVAFLPLPEPADGVESEGPNDISFGPRTFPLPLRNGIFVGMHGKFSLGGVANEENPVVVVDLRDNSYFHFISNDEPDIGHLDGIIATRDSLFLADISPGGGFATANANTGKIYQVQSLYPDIDALSQAIRNGDTHPVFDLDRDGDVDPEDRRVWIEVVNETFVGDSNLDGQFDSSDFVAVFVAGLYEIDRTATWSAGDWNGDARVSSADIVVAFQRGGYEKGFRLGPAAAVPEPSYGVLGVVGSCWMFQTVMLRGRTRSITPARRPK